MKIYSFCIFYILSVLLNENEVLSERRTENVIDRIHVRATESKYNFRGRKRRSMNYLDCVDKVNVKISLPPEKFAENHAIVVDHIFDAESGQKAYLLNPYLIIVKQFPPQLSYDLRQVGIVNGEVKEEVINKEYSIEKGFRGCDDYSTNPTCGISFNQGSYIPFSQGFCCSCDEKINKVRQYGSRNGDYNRNSPIRKRSISIHSSNETDHDAIESNKKRIKKSIEVENGYNFEPGIKNRQTYKKRQECMNDSFPNLRDFSFQHNVNPPQQKNMFVMKNQIYPNKNPNMQGNLQTNLFKEDGVLNNQGRQLFNNFDNIHKNMPQQENHNPAVILKLEPVAFQNDNNFKNFEYSNEDALAKEKEASMKEDLKNSQQYAGVKQNVKNSNNMKLDNKYPMNKQYDVLVPNYLKDDLLHPKVYQIRGGQNCMDTYTPPYCDPIAYHDSAHCLRFSDTWYSVNDLSVPKIAKDVMIKVYEKRETHKGPVWIDLLNKRSVKIGTNKNKFRGRNMEAEYIFPQYKNLALDPQEVKLLIPKDIYGTDKREKRHNPEEFLVVNKKNIDLSGKSCDKIGIAYEGFFNQPNRCEKPQGTCLKNQPLELVRHDRNLEARGQRGHYFLKYFADVQNGAYKTFEKEDDNLVLEYQLDNSDTVKIQIKSNGNALFNGRYSATITEIYLDTTNPYLAEIYIKIHNSGLMTNLFKTVLSNCSWDLPAKWNLETELTSIPAQLQIAFKIKIPCKIPSGIHYCTVSALNIRNYIVAQRKIRIVRNDVCICNWYCNCACLRSPNGLECRLLSRTQYNAAGFRGCLPLVKSVIRITIDEAMALGVFTFLILLAIILFLLGLTKALIGCCFCRPTGLFGLKVLLGLPRPIKCYYERCLRCRPVVYDARGWPVHPDTCRRTVRPISCILEFFINTVFFFIYPPMMFFILVKELICYSSEQRRDKKYKVERIDKIVFAEACAPCASELDYESTS